MLLSFQTTTTLYLLSLFAKTEFSFENFIHFHSQMSDARCDGAMMVTRSNNNVFFWWPAHQKERALDLLPVHFDCNLLLQHHFCQSVALCVFNSTLISLTLCQCGSKHFLALLFLFMAFLLLHLSCFVKLAVVFYFKFSCCWWRHQFRNKKADFLYF